MFYSKTTRSGSNVFHGGGYFVVIKDTEIPFHVLSHTDIGITSLVHPITRLIRRICQAIGDVGGFLV